MPTPPKDPDFFDKVNYVTKAWSRPCRAPWFIYVETAAPAALEAVITLLAFDLADIMRAYFRPAGLGKGGHHRARGKKRLPRLLGIPEIGEFIGKEIPGQKEMSQRKYGAAQRWFWLIDNELQKGFFWWMVADVANDFAFNWTSQLYATEWCYWSDKGYYNAEDPSGQIISGVLGWQTIGVNGSIDDHGPPHWFGSKGTTGLRGAFVGIAFEGHPIAAGATVEIRFVESDGVNTRITPVSHETNPDGSMSFAHGLEVSHTSQFYWQARATPVSNFAFGLSNIVSVGQEL